MTTRKPCVNVSTATYSGKEQSPLHFGLSAEGYELNTIMEGYDKMMWIVKMKNNKKVWIRHSNTVNKMIHEEPVIDTSSIPETPDTPKTQETTQSLEQKPPEILKAVVVEEKKTTDYNLFLTYRLHELKQNSDTKGSNKEVFNSVVAEWKELKKNPEELKNIIQAAQEFHATHQKTPSKSSKSK